MDDLHERLQQIERNPSPDLWEEITDRAVGTVPSTSTQHGWRRVAVIAASLAIGLAAVAWVVIAIRPTTSPPVVADQPILSPAPRSDCPIGPVRTGAPVSTDEYVRLSEGYLPTWMPEGFGVLATYGPEEAIDGHTAYGIWSDERCREVEFTFNSNWIARSPEYVDPDASVGPWVVEGDVPGGCGNAVLGEARCLHYSAATVDGHLSLSMMGLDREEGDRIVLSIFSGESLPATTTLLVSSSGPSGDTAGLSGTLTTDNGCVAVATGPASSIYVVWPAGYSLADEGGETWLVDDSGNQVARIGDEIQMGGGITNLAHAEPSVPGGIPSSCEVGGPDAYWFAGTPELVAATFTFEEAEGLLAERSIFVTPIPLDQQVGLLGEHEIDRAVQLWIGRHDRLKVLSRFLGSVDIPDDHFNIEDRPSYFVEITGPETGNCFYFFDAVDGEEYLGACFYPARSGPPTR